MKVTITNCSVSLETKKKGIILRNFGDIVETLEKSCKLKKKKLVAVNRESASVHFFLYEGAEIIVGHNAASWFECRNAEGEKK